jgi:hypothetical protein
MSRGRVRLGGKQFADQAASNIWKLIHRVPTLTRSAPSRGNGAGNPTETAGAPIGQRRHPAADRRPPSEG